MKAYYQLTEVEKLALTNDDLADAIKLEAIERKMKPPISLSEALVRSEWRGYSKPAEAIEVYEVNCGHYGNSGIGYLDKELATRALHGMVKIEHGYKDNPRLEKGEATIRVVFIGTSSASQKWARLEEYTQDDTEFDKLRDECVDDLAAIRQRVYNARVRAERRVEYLRLAGGNEEIAKAFWAKAEGTEWPVA